MFLSVCQYVFSFLLVTLFSGYFQTDIQSINQASNNTYTINLQLIAENLTAPVSMTSPRDGSNRLFVCEQPGLIRIIEKQIFLDEPFLDIREKVDRLSSSYSEKGLLGLAFHPNYKNNGRFFVHYSAPDKSGKNDHISTLSEFTVSENKNIANSKERIILTLAQPESNHNGGPIVFGPDGYLYISFGDGGGAGDKHGNIGNGQNLNTWLGKILRIDINGEPPYSVPEDNPFYKGKGKPEIFAYGLRNPWGLSFDRLNNTFFSADVGQNKFEEINIIQKGLNYGWRITEGYHCYDPSVNCVDDGLTYPVNEHSHNVGISVAGGYVYRSSGYPSLFGLYIYGDWTGKLFALNFNSKGKWERHDLQIKNDQVIEGNLNALGEDENGNIYIATQKKIGPFSMTGKILKIKS